MAADEQLGRKTARGLLFTRGGSILLFREENSSRTATRCCSRVGCGSKLSSQPDRNPHCDRRGKPAAAGASSSSRAAVNLIKHGQKGGNFRPAQDRSSSGGSAGHELLARLKDRVRATTRRSTGGAVTRSSERSRTSSDDTDALALFSSIGVQHQRTGVDPPEQLTDSTDDEALTGLLNHRMIIQDTGLLNIGDADNLISEGRQGYWRFSTDDHPESFLLPGTSILDYVLLDRHREMRLDIDNMSYEELLALGDRIGTVSTGLSREAMSRCVKRSIYVPRASAGSARRNEGEAKCTICQEEHVVGDDVGRMRCQHLYHWSCIGQWLSQKNWCPVCKTAATSAATGSNC